MSGIWDSRSGSGRASRSTGSPPLICYHTQGSHPKNPVDEDQGGQDDKESEQDRPARQARLGDAYEEALHASESSDDEGEERMMIRLLINLVASLSWEGS
ncbi:hypothetical protein PGTUg99_031345 [Puccinia graminis f. sp. tritici]|uniref:Uncharacterized protein n=1 Tax=Puccinia graminis f. sp. tritici TaxID=56615 RepID=A0A5B0S644_PUCGR|nr:hypothetical protein PGTUg99_031345 [Puccinia graminis f. sp. tritici]